MRQSGFLVSKSTQSGGAALGTEEFHSASFRQAPLGVEEVSHASKCTGIPGWWKKKPEETTTLPPEIPKA